MLLVVISQGMKLLEEKKNGFIYVLNSILKEESRRVSNFRHIFILSLCCGVTLKYNLSVAFGQNEWGFKE